MAALTIGSPDPVYVVPLTSNGNGTATDGTRTYPIGSPVPVYVVAATSNGNGTAADGGNILTVGSPAPIYVVSITDNGNGTATDGARTLTIGSRAPIYVVPITGNGNGTATDGARTLTVGSPVPVYVVSVASGSVAYTGPGDIVSGATAWYGLRGYSGAYAAPGTNKAINIRRASDNATMDIVIKPDGTLDVAAATTFLAATTGFITKVYDQTGNGRDATQVTAANQPQLVLSAIGSLPGMVSDGTQYLVTTAPAVSQPLSAVAVAKRTGNFATQSDIICAQDGVFFRSANEVSCFFGALVVASATDNVNHSLIWSINAASSNTYVDNVSTPGSAGVNPLDASYNIFAQQNGLSKLTGNIYEVGLWGVALDATQAANMNTNQHTYWGF